MGAVEKVTVGGLAAIFAGAAVHAYYKLSPVITDGVDLAVAVGGTAGGTVLASVAGAVIGFLVLGVVSALAFGHAKSGSYAGLALGAFLGISSGYQPSQDFLKDMVQEPVATVAPVDTKKVDDAAKISAYNPVTGDKFPVFKV